MLALLPLVGCGSGAADTQPGAGTGGSIADSAVGMSSGGGAGGGTGAGSGGQVANGGGQANDAGLTDAGVERDDGGHTDAGTSCVSVTGGGPEPWWDAEILGQQFDAYEGERMRVVVSAAGRVGVAQDTIVRGAFALTLPNAINHTAYTEIALYVDRDENDACDVGEPLWGFVRGAVRDDLVVEATPQGGCVSGGGAQVGAGCRPWLRPVGPCAVNGQADLEIRMPCPP